jgi:hypothetical protein
MPADYTIKQADGGTFAYQLTNQDGSPYVIPPGSTLTFVMRSLTQANAQQLTGTAAVDNPETGQVHYTFTAADTATVGLYMASFVVAPPSGGPFTFPQVGYLWISIEENLTTAGGQQLVSLPDVKDYLAIDSGDRSHDAKLLRFISAVRPLIEQVVGPVIPQTFTEWHDGGQTTVRLRRRPSTALGCSPVLNVLGAVEFRGPTPYTLSLVQNPALATLYSIHLDPRTATLTRRTTGGGVISFAQMPESVYVAYQAGQQTVPWNIYEAALEAIRVNYRTTLPTGRGSRSQTDETDTGPPLGFFLPRRCRELLAPQRRHPSIA